MKRCDHRPPAIINKLKATKMATIKVPVSGCLSRSKQTTLKKIKKGKNPSFKFLIFSLRAASQAAKKTIKPNFKNSDGWNVVKPRSSQRLAPLVPNPIPGTKTKLVKTSAKAKM